MSFQGGAEEIVVGMKDPQEGHAAVRVLVPATLGPLALYTSGVPEAHCMSHADDTVEASPQEVLRLRF